MEGFNKSSILTKLANTNRVTKSKMVKMKSKENPKISWFYRIRKATGSKGLSRNGRRRERTNLGLSKTMLITGRRWRSCGGKRKSKRNVRNERDKNKPKRNSKSLRKSLKSYRRRRKGSQRKHGRSWQRSIRKNGVIPRDQPGPKKGECRLVLVTRMTTRKANFYKRSTRSKTEELPTILKIKLNSPRKKKKRKTSTGSQTVLAQSGLTYS